MCFKLHQTLVWTNSLYSVKQDNNTMDSIYLDLNPFNLTKKEKLLFEVYLLFSNHVDDRIRHASPCPRESRMLPR